MAAFWTSSDGTYGVEPDWFAAWLSDRSQAVRGGTHSEPVTHGVVQGSVLDSILFLLFTNNLTQQMLNTKVIMYADDTQFFDSGEPKNIHDLKTRIESTLSTAHDWFTRNRLKINPSKTEMVIFQSQRIRQNPDFLSGSAPTLFIRHTAPRFWASCSTATCHGMTTSR